MNLAARIGAISLGILMIAQSGDMPSETKNPLIIADVDTGRDDAWMLFGAIKDCRIEAVVASYGNVPLPLTIRNSLDVVSLAEKGEPHHCHVEDIPVWKGESQPLQPSPAVSAAEITRRARTNGNGLCNLTLPHSDQTPANHSADWAKDVVGFIKQHGTADYIIAGPLTNMAKLIDAFGTDADGKPEITKHIRRVIVMGGSFDPKLAVDFNFKADPSAAQKVLSTFGEQVTLVPYDETKKLKLTEDEIQHLKPEDRAASFSQSLMLAQARGWSADHTVLLHDPSTLLALEQGAALREERISVVQDGEQAGKVVADPHGVTVLRMVIPSGEEARTRNRLLHRYLDFDLP